MSMLIIFVPRKFSPQKKREEVCDWGREEVLPIWYVIVLLLWLMCLLLDIVMMLGDILFVLGVCHFVSRSKAAISQACGGVLGQPIQRGEVGEKGRRAASIPSMMALPRAA